MIRWTVAASLLLATAAWSQEAMYDSFEDGVPEYWSATRPDSLSLSDLHAKHGTRSLRWDWRADEALEIRHGVGDVRRTGGYGGYHKATFAIWLYCAEPVDGAAVVQFLAGDEVGGQFDFPLGFSGWRRAALHYRWGEEFTGTVSPDTDTIRILAPEDAPQGTLFIDLVVYNGLLDYRLACIPVQAFAWRPVDPEQARPPVRRPETLTDDQRAAVEALAASLYPNTEPQGVLTPERMAELGEQFAAFGIERRDGAITGLPLAPHPDMYESAGVPDPPQTPSALAQFMREIAALYHWTGDGAQKQQIAEWYLAAADHLHDQGFAAGSGNSWGGYAGRPLADAMYWMREPVRAAGRGEREASFFDYNWGVSRVLDADAEIRVTLDLFGIVEPRRLRGCLMRPDPLEAWHWTACFADLLSRNIVKRDVDGFKPDGSAYHHGAHYFAYASYNVSVLVSIIAQLDDTPFEIAPAAIDRVRLYLRRLSFCANLLDVPFPWHGRHPFRGGVVRPHMYRDMALSGPGAGEEDFDPELAATYLRLLGAPPEEDPFPGHEVTVAAPPQGNLVMPYAGTMAHRRDDWLVTAHATGKYFWATEIYANVNAFGGYIGAGDLCVLAGGDPISLAGSGYVAEGWDWSRFDGTTVVYLPIDEVRNPRNGTQHPRTSHAFAGGLSHRGTHGLMLHRTEGPEWLAAGLRATKTCFAFDDRIICLGSGITAEVPDRPVQTNLFQRHLPDSATPIIANGEALAGLDVERKLPSDRASWLIDTVGTGFVAPAGQSLHVARRRQLSRDKDDTRDTEGEFATCWLDHGVLPAAANYEYALIPRATPERMAALAAALDDGPRPWEVLRRDEAAHIVRDRATGISACVLIEAGPIEPELPVAAVDRPCLLMIEPDGDGLWLTVCDPDLNLQDNLSVPRELLVELRGAWRLGDAPEEMRVAGQADGTTALAVTCHDGESFTARLRPTG